MPGVLNCIAILVLGLNHVPAEKIRVGRDYQATVPEFIPVGGKKFNRSNSLLTLSALRS